MAIGKSEKVSFTNLRGDVLAARLDRPLSRPRAYALFAHCFTCSKDIFAAARVAQGLVQNGIAVLRFDFTGLGSSEGEFENTNFSSNVDDLVAAAEFLQENYAAPDLLIGHSLGGAAVLVAAKHIPSAKAVATIGAPADPDHVKENFSLSLDTIKEEGIASVCLAGRPFTIKKQFLEDIASQNLEKDVTALSKALLVFHSPLDQTVGIENAATLFTAAKHPKSFITLDEADHLLSRRQDAIFVADTLTAWVNRYLPSLDEKHQLAEGEVLVNENELGKFAQIISVSDTHTLLADEPKSIGGDDSGPTPYGFLLSGLGACTTMTIRMYADRKKIPLQHVSVKLNHAKIHAHDCEACETASGKIDRIERVVTLKGDLTEEERQKLLEIADKCPVHRTLHSEVDITTALSA
ncbi:MAG: bifunctional alpha/beta hydrolase/OsmC family protein [Sneathiellales bacterium]|nr:bifunctional alpha/beta hydrolase/OsmC family protein [Sneathiellales bacterium]